MDPPLSRMFFVPVRVRKREYHRAGAAVSWRFCSRALPKVMRLQEDLQNALSELEKSKKELLPYAVARHKAITPCAGLADDFCLDLLPSFNAPGADVHEMTAPLYIVSALSAEADLAATRAVQVQQESLVASEQLERLLRARARTQEAISNSCALSSTRTQEALSRAFKALSNTCELSIQMKQTEADLSTRREEENSLVATYAMFERNRELVAKAEEECEGMERERVTVDWVCAHKTASEFERLRLKQELAEARAREAAGKELISDLEDQLHRTRARLSEEMAHRKTDRYRAKRASWKIN
jgi:hypothetical protein